MAMKCQCQQSGGQITLCLLHGNELRRRMFEAAKTVEKQRLLLSEALAALTWCSGAADFQPAAVHRDAAGPTGMQPEGKARSGWLRGPALVIQRLQEALSGS